MFRWLFANKRKGNSTAPELGTRKSVMKELAMRASIADKLKNYNADEDTTISEFSLADDEKRKQPIGKGTRVTEYDVWGQANPRETGRWNREVRLKRNRVQAGRHSIKSLPKKN